MREIWKSSRVQLSAFKTLRKSFMLKGIRLEEFLHLLKVQQFFVSQLNRKEGKNFFNMLIKLAICAMVNTCIMTAREINICVQLNKSLLLKGKQPQKSSTEKARTEGWQSKTWHRKKSAKGKVWFTGSSPNEFHPFTRLKGSSPSSPRDFFPQLDSRITEHSCSKKR